jgi:uncharacterized protein (TIGR00255 family)
MILSMTGYGSATVESANYKISIELKSLNNKYFELSLRVPRIYMQYEHKLRQLLSNELQRGKVSMFLNAEVMNPEKRSLNINRVLAKAYLEEINSVRAELGVSKEVDIPFLMGLPEIIPVESATPDPEEWDLIQKAALEAAQKLTASRRDEGEALARDLENRVEAISANLKEVETRAPERIEAIRERLLSSLTDLKSRVDFDPNRFEQELIFYIEKLDINEEIVRLRQHLTYFEKMKKEPKSNGKKLNFIAQEMGREINTIGSKAQNADIQRFVVTMKDELDKIKEQVLNIV